MDWLKLKFFFVSFDVIMFIRLLVCDIRNCKCDEICVSVKNDLFILLRKVISKEKVSKVFFFGGEIFYL